MELRDYEIRDTLARSPRSLVRRAIRRGDGQPVVIKSLVREYPPAHEVAQLEFEHRILSKLDAPGVIRVLGLEKGVDRSTLVLEDFGGRDLPFLFSDPMPLDLFFEIAIPVAKALGYIHGQNIIHKDIKPLNIVFNPDSRQVKLIDFNISSELSHEHQDITVADQLEGSMPYISPEQTGRMNRDVDYRSDYYSLGVTFFELLTAALPFTATDLLSWVHCHISKPVPGVRDLRPDVPEPLARIIAKLMAKNANDRYQSARGLLKDLERCRRDWGAHGTIADFAIASQDRSERFQLSQELFGRERESAALLAAFESARQGSARLMLVAGYSGVGKSSLIHELHRSIVMRHGAFVSGKFDQLRRDVPYAALGQALRSLVRHLLAEPEDRLRVWRDKISAAMGPNGQVLVDVIPELEQVVGPQPAPVELSAREAQARFQHVFRELIRALAQPEHPLVIFIDDLQWADASTPELLVQLLSDEQLRHLLVIGAYRDNEVKEGHPLLAAVNALSTSRPDIVQQILLTPLSITGVNQVVAATLHCAPDISQQLADLVFQKTAGNPFFVNELLRSLYRDGAFHFVAEEGHWQWQRDKIDRSGISDNVVAHMIKELKRLPVETIDCLSLAACIGYRFDLRTVAWAADLPAGSTAMALQDAVKQQVIIPLRGSYRLIQQDGEYDEAGLLDLDVQYQFQHDRVQQAAYSLIEGEKRARAHVALGRRLLATYDRSHAENDVFDVVNHLNLGRELITSIEQRAELARLNQVAGQRARHAAAYAIAASYFEISLDLLLADEWTGQPGPRFECEWTRAECLLLAGSVERASVLCDRLIKSAPDNLSGAAALRLKALVVDRQGRLAESIEAIRQGLRLLGVELSEDHGEIDRKIGEGIGKMQAHLARTPIEEFVALPEMTDPAKIMTMNLLLQVVAPAIQIYPPLFILAELMMFDLALIHGTSVVSCKNFVDCGIIQGGILGDYAGAYRLGKVAFALLERYAPTPIESGVNFVFANFVSHWRAPYQEGVDAFARARRVGIDMGDVQHAAYAYTLGAHRLVAIGRPLAECQGEVEAAQAFFRDVHAVIPLSGVRVVERAVARLRGPSREPVAGLQSDEEFTAETLATQNAQWLFLHGQTQAMVSFILSDVEGAERWGQFTAPYLPAAGGLFNVPDHYLFQALVLTKKWTAAGEAERAAIRQELSASERRLRTWAENSPTNFAHKHKLLAAEMARIGGVPLEEVIQLYDEALAAAGEGFIHLRAVTNELQAELWIERGQRKIARTFLDEAYYLYERWGASQKLRQLARKYPEWVSGSSGRVVAGPLTAHTITRDTVSARGALDVASVIKATQAISGEVRPDKLFAKLMATIVENAGAQRGCLILKDDRSGELLVEVGVHEGSEAPGSKRRVPIAAYGELCHEIVRYVARTSDAVVLDDAAHDPAYEADPYIRRSSVRSVLCVPVLNQGRLLAILYAENNQASYAFTPHRLSLLQVIASQAAISIVNARLYDSLEEKVEERTRALAAKNRQVAVMLKSVQQGIFTIDDSLTIQPQYSDHLEQLLGASDLAGRPCLEMLFGGSNIAPDALAAMDAALQFSFGVPAFMAGLNAGHLVREFRRPNPDGELRSFEVDWHLISGEAQENGGAVNAILVALRDVTVLRKLNERVAEKGRELDVVGQILEAGLSAFNELCRSARGYLEDSATVLRATGPLAPAALEQIFRNIHTIKGHARLLGLGHLVNSVHRAEEALSAWRDAPDAIPDRAHLGAQLAAISVVLEQHAEICARRLSDLAPGQDAGFEQLLTEIEALVGGASGPVDEGQVLRSVKWAAQRARAVSLRVIVKEVARMVPSLARELRKTPPTVDCGGDDFVLTRAWGNVMRDALVHVLRNAIDHGIEGGDERHAGSKPPQGRITVDADQSDGRPVIRIADDGRGLAVNKLRQKIEEAGGRLDASDEDIADQAFLSGVSSATTLSAVSGRGVGLDAVRTFVRQQGGDVRIQFTGERHEGTRRFVLIFELPADAVMVPGGPPLRAWAEPPPTPTVTPPAAALVARIPA